MKGFLAVLMLLPAPFVATPTSAASDQEADRPDARSVEQVVRDVYDLVSWTDGNTPDWEVVREVFIPEAVIVLRYPPDLQVMSVDGFLLDWLRFENQLAAAGATGFKEEVLETRVMVFGDIAQVEVVYQSSIPETGRPPQPGVDLWSLIRIEDEWKVVSVINELPRGDLPLPNLEG